MQARDAAGCKHGMLCDLSFPGFEFDVAGSYRYDSEGGYTIPSALNLPPRSRARLCALART